MKVIVLAKEPKPGRVKTRLCPPCSPDQAARLAEAALADTFAAAIASGADEVVAVLDGQPGPWCPPGVRVVNQVDGPFDRRLAAAWDTVGGPAVQIGMDTPQTTAAHLDAAMTELAGSGTDAVLGMANDGGWWIIGLHRADPAVFLDIPMSCSDTGVLQRRRLIDLGLTVRDIEPLTDVDSIDDTMLVGSLAPDTRFARALAAMSLPVGQAS
ncbi:MAG: DUF2064 domain-containing protein [Microthrixaceae bacterium]